MKHFPRPNGELQGDNRPMPNRGTGTGMSGHDTKLDGHGIGSDDCNRMGGIKRHTKSDAADESCPPGDRG